MIDIKWYGINALEIRHPNGTFMIDPYVSRNNKKLFVQSETDKYLTSSPDFVLMTHAHWDHLPDMPELIRKTGTCLYASKTACNIMRALKVPEQNLHELTGGEQLNLPGGVRVTVLESRHMGIIPETDCYAHIPAPALLNEARGWLCGEIFAYLIELDKKTILNIGSANLLERTMHGIQCDYLICGISRWQEGFPELLLKNINFSYLLPTHHDEFTLPLNQFYLRNDLERLKKAIPGLHYKELKILNWLSID